MRESRKGIYLILTRNCNLACPYCYQRFSKLTKSPDYKNIDKAVEWMFKEDIFGHVTVTGGEPFIEQKKLYHLLDLVKEYNRKRHPDYKILISFISNGTIYLPKLKEYIGSAIDGHLQFSIDGYKLLNDITRIWKDKDRNDSTYDLIMENAKKYKNDGFNVDFHGVISRENMVYLTKSLKLLIKDIKSMNSHISYEIEHTRKWSIRDLIGYYKFRKEAFEILKLNNRISFSREPNTNHSTNCSAGFTFLGIDVPTGRIYGCHEYSGTDENVLGQFTNFNKPFVNMDLIKKQIPYTDISGYRFQYLPYKMSQKLLRRYHLHICWKQNLFLTGDKGKIPFFILIIGMINKYFQKKLNKYLKFHNRQKINIDWNHTKDNNLPLDWQIKL